MPSIADTHQEIVHLVLPENANTHGNLFGGRMMYWIVGAATLPALRIARGPILLGSMDNLDFLSPVRVGDLVVLRAQIEYVGRASMEVAVEVDAENPATGERRPATSARLTMVAVDAQDRPRPVGATIAPADASEREAFEAARARKMARDLRLATYDPQRGPGLMATDSLTWSIEVARLVFPEDAISGTTMFAGTLLLAIDECASILALRYTGGHVVTAALDGLDFYAPIHVGNIVIYQAALNYVGRTSLEVGVRVLAEDPITQTVCHTCTTYLTTVHVDASGRPAPVRPFVPETVQEQRRWEEAEARRAARQERRSR
jgi:acyl-CoA hydrolase